nr:hypothetical protein [Prevotella intermedia]
MKALQNLLFCFPKAALLQRKTYAFTVQNSRFRNAKAQLSIFNRIIFTKSNRKTLITSLGKNTKNT